MARNARARHRYQRARAPSLRGWEKPHGPHAKKIKSDAVLEMGWGRLIFGHTFRTNRAIADKLIKDNPGRRDIAFYISDPHVILSMAPQKLFLDPSHTFRLWLDQYRPGHPRPKGLLIRRLRSTADVREINRIYATRHMVQADPDYLVAHRKSRIITYLIAEDTATGTIVGTVAGVDHVTLFNDPEQGSSLWSLAVDPQAPYPGVGEALVRYLSEHFLALGRSYMDLSVMHDNEQAVALYEKLAFQRVPVFAIKHRHPINEPLFAAPPADEQLNPYAELIINEARRRGIAVQILDADAGYFSLTYGGRSVICRESLTELTTAIAMSQCDDKQITRRVLTRAGLRMPDQAEAGPAEDNNAFLESHKRVVVKPARGEQGRGIAVDVRTEKDLASAISAARRHCETVLIEELIKRMDVRVIVIDNRVVATATRRPPEITGTGEHTVEDLIRKLSRRRSAATGGESRIPLDAETERCVRSEGYEMDAVLPAAATIRVRKTANLHTGGTIHDVTDQLHPDIVRAAQAAAQALNIPVVGMDFMMPDIAGNDYYIIEANERPGLANHEPQPTAERFIDMLFPQSAVM